MIFMRKTDIAAIMILVAFVVLVSIPVYTPKERCEVARSGYDCASIEEVLIENCNFIAAYKGYNKSEIQVRWYIENLCALQNRYHNTALNCSDVDLVCNEILGSQLIKG